ncbi:MAG TPA: OsmC family protein [Gaiellaceae bacterium]|nr:OsmC family protein [Gaiellaceae bacterium]
MPASPPPPDLEAPGGVAIARRADGGLEVRARDVTLAVGRGEGTLRSVELLLAALGSCMLGTMLVFADNVGISLAGVSLELTPTLAGGPERVSRIDMTMRIDGDVEPKRLASLRRVAEHCKVHSTLEHGPELTLAVES